jgi:hypothetical protein
VAEHGILDLESTLAGPTTGEPEPPPHHRVDEGEEHRQIVRRRWSGGESGFPRPTGLRLETPTANQPIAAPSIARIHRRDVLGGLIHEYRADAA